MLHEEERIPYTDEERRAMADRRLQQQIDVLQQKCDALKEGFLDLQTRVKDLEAGNLEKLSEARKEIISLQAAYRCHAPWRIP